MSEDVTGKYHKAIVAGVASGIVAAISVLTGAMSPTDTFGDIPAVTWLWALAAFIVGSGVTGGAVAVSRANSTGYSAANPQNAGTGALVQPSQSAGAPSTVQPQQAVGGAASPGPAQPHVAPSYPNPPGMKG